MIFLTRVMGLRGGIGRLRYWGLLLFAAVVILVAATVGSLNLRNGPIQLLSYGILLSSGWPVLSATTRRLRDADLSPWYAALLIAIPTTIQICSLIFDSEAFALGIASAAVTLAGFAALGTVPSKLPLSSL